jgi:hypothetical protein
MLRTMLQLAVETDLAAAVTRPATKSRVNLNTLSPESKHTKNYKLIE